MLRVDNLSKKFKNKEVLHGIDFELEYGVYGLLGENGAGKSTLMRCILGLYTDYTGKISYDNVYAFNKEKIGYLPQHFNGLEELKVGELLNYFADIKKIPKKATNDEIDRVLDKVNLLDRKDSKVRDLSGGMKQRIGIAQTLIGDPGMIVYDEPTTGLDPKERIRFENIIEEEKTSKTILISTHIVSDIEYLCDEIIVMKEGELIGIYKPLELAKCADEKVYEITEEEYKNKSNEVILIRKYLANDKFMVRVMSDGIIQGKPLKATVEDGYLWVSK